jgi:sodium transport system ATP-binding protein
VASRAILVENIEKVFPPAYVGFRAFLSPFSRPTQRALQAVSFHVEKGESFAILGANGAGKSTLLRILTTLLLPTEGRAEISGYDVIEKPISVRRSVGFHSGAEAGFYARLSARQNLQFFARLRNLSSKEASRRIAETAGRVGITQALDRQVRTLSSGTVQRLSLARAVMHAPSVLLLDEPTRSLDPLAAADFRSFVRDDLINRHGTTLLFASHSLTEVEALADRVALLDAGHLLFCGTLAELRACTPSGSAEEAMSHLIRGSSAERSSAQQFSAEQKDSRS